VPFDSWTRTAVAAPIKTLGADRVRLFATVYTAGRWL
jgi:hypothetical protein